MLSRNAKMKRETDLRLLEMPSRRAKPIKIFWKRQNEAGNRSNSPKSHFLRRETEKILRKVISRGGKAEKCFGKRLRAAGRRLKVSEIGFARREKGRTAYALRTFPTETISHILINRIGTGCLKCPPFLSPLRCIWRRKHYAPTASGAFVLNGIEQCPQKKVRRIPVTPILRTHAETKTALCEGRRL